MTRYVQWRENPSSAQPQTPASYPVTQPLVAHRSTNLHGTHTPTSSSIPSSSPSHAYIPFRSRTPSPYDQSPTEDDRARRERVDALVREDPRRRAPSLRGREEEGRRRAEEQHRQEVDGILRRQREAEHAAQAARLGQPTGQNQRVTASVMPVSPAEYSLKSPTWCVILFGDRASFSGS